MAEQSSCKWYDPSCTFQWLSDEFKAFWIYIYDSFMGGLAAVVESIPVPDFLANAQIVHLPNSVSWFLDAFNIGTGLFIVVGAYTARFILRRIPFIG
jgi:hypothetical protein